MTPVQLNLTYPQDNSYQKPMSMYFYRAISFYLSACIFILLGSSIFLGNASAATVSCTSSITPSSISNGDDVVVLSGQTCFGINFNGKYLNSITVNSGGFLAGAGTSGFLLNGNLWALGATGVRSVLNDGTFLPSLDGVQILGTVPPGGSFTNNGLIDVTNPNANIGIEIGRVFSDSSFVFTNAGTIRMNSSNSDSVALNFTSTLYPAHISSINNYGYLGGVTNAALGLNFIISAGGTSFIVDSIFNSGSITTIKANSYAVYIGSISSVGTLENSSTGSISSIGNTGAGIWNDGAITTINNSGSIAANGLESFGVYNTGTISTLNNFGSITASGDFSAGIYNTGTISTLNNAQGAGNSTGPLTYLGTLPTNYNIIINSISSFGRLAVTFGTGITSFGIYAGSTVQNNRNYASVLSGVSVGNLDNTSGTYGGLSWALNLAPGQTTIWDLCFGLICSSDPPPEPTPTGPSTADTQQSLVNTSAALQNTFTLQNTVLANSFTYDCTEFGSNGVCLSAGGRNTAVQAANGLNNTSGLLIAAYRPHPNYRIGAYADQNLSVSNAGGTVNLGNNTPLIGLFGAWNQRLDGTGTELKISAAYGQKNTTVNRGVVGSGATASEAGSGSSQLNSQGAQVSVKYGFAVTDKAVISPYVGVRYTQNNMGGYTEGTSSTVTAPLTYSALNTNATTALAGIGASYKVIPTVTTFASVGVETDTNTANGSYSGTNSTITGLTPVNFNANPVKTRPTATLGAYYDIVKNQRLGITGIYRQEAYQAVSTTTVMATYTVGL